MNTEQTMTGFLEELKNAFAGSDIVKLKQLANAAINIAVPENNKLIAKIALIAYSLHKLMTKEHIANSKNWQSVKKTILASIENAFKAAKKKDSKVVEKNLDLIIEDVNKIDQDLGYFLTSLFDKAKIKLASTAYVLGASMSQAAELTGADKKELQQYIANTVIHEEKIPKTGIAERIKKFKKTIE